VKSRFLGVALAAWITALTYPGQLFAQAPVAGDQASSPSSDPAPRFRATLLGGYGASTAGNPELGAPLVGLSASYRLSNTEGSTISIPLLVAFPLSKGVEAYLTGLELGDVLYLRGLVGIAGGSVCEEFSGAGTCTATGERSETRLALGLAVGLRYRFTRAFGLDAQAFVAKGLGLHGAVVGVVAGPMLALGAGDAAAQRIGKRGAPREDRGSHLELALVQSWYRSSEGEGTTDTLGPRIAYVLAFEQGFGLGFGARVGSGVGGFDFTLHYRFDRFTGDAWAPYLVASSAFLFGISRSGDLIAAPDLSLGGGGGIDFRLTGGTRLGPSFRWYHPVVSGKSYTGPIDASMVLSIDF